MKKEMNYKSMDSLDIVIRAVNEAQEALNDTTRVKAVKVIPQVLAGAGGAATGGAIGLGALYNLGVSGLSAAGITSGLATAGGLIGGGMVAGIAVLAAPAVILTAGAVAISGRITQKKIEEKKEELLKASVAKYDAIVRTLNNDVNMTKERVEYLNNINTILQVAIRDLRADLAKVK